MTRHFVPFSDSWRMPIDIHVSRGVVEDGLLFICGQCDLDAEGRPQRPNDLAAQTEVALDHLVEVVRQAEMTDASLDHLHVFYRHDGSIDEAAYGQEVARLLPGDGRPTTVLTPVPAFFYPGVAVEIDAVLSRRPAFRYVQGQGGNTEDAVDDFSTKLKALDGVIEDLCKLTIYLDAGMTEAERAMARDIIEAGSGSCPSTSVIVPNLGPNRIRIDGIAATEGRVESRDQNGLKAVRVGRTIFIGGLLALDHKNRVMRPEDLSAQTHLVMDSLGQHLAAFGADFEHLVKVNTYYRSDGAPRRCTRT